MVVKVFQTSMAANIAAYLTGKLHLYLSISNLFCKFV